jgi:hypothetical protein
MPAFATYVGATRRLYRSGFTHKSIAQRFAMKFGLDSTSPFDRT